MMVARGKRQVSVGTLGSCYLTVEGRPVSGVPANFYKIAAYLLLSARSHKISRQRLWQVLWSDIDEADRSAANLRRALARIRALQFANNFRLIECTFSIVYLIDEQRIEWDLRDLLGYLSGDGDTTPIAYPGELLPDLGDCGPEFEDWLSAQRDSLRNRYIDRLADSMTRSAWTQNASSARRAIAQEILQVDPCNEEAYRVLMVEAASSQNTARLEQVFKKCEFELRRELGVPISHETRTLYLGLRKALMG